MKELRGKLAVVTGGGSGIGRATVLALAREGVRVVVVDVDPGRAKETVELVGRSGGRAFVETVDVSSATDMQALAARVVEDHGGVDIVVNNAGIAPGPVPTTDFPLDRFRRVMEVNFWGAVHGSVAFLPHLRTRPEGNLVNVASETSFMGFPRMAAYCSSKFAVRGFTETLRMEMAGTPVKVSVVCPGSTKTSIMANSPVMDDEERIRIGAQFAESWGLPPERVAKAIVRAVRKDKPRVLVGPDTIALDMIVRMLPGSHSRLLAPGVNRFMNSVLGRP